MAAPYRLGQPRGDCPYRVFTRTTGFDITQILPALPLFDCLRAMGKPVRFYRFFVEKTMRRFRWLIYSLLGLVGACLSLLFAPGTWLNRAVSLAVCAVLSTEPTICSRSAAQRSQRTVAAEVPSIERVAEVLAQRDREFTDPDPPQPSGNQEAPPFPSDPGTDYIRPDFGGEEGSNSRTLPISLAGTWNYSLYESRDSSVPLGAEVVNVSNSEEGLIVEPCANNCQSLSVTPQGLYNDVPVAISDAEVYGDISISWSLLAGNQVIRGAIQHLPSSETIYFLIERQESRVSPEGQLNSNPKSSLKKTTLTAQGGVGPVTPGGSTAGGGNPDNPNRNPNRHQNRNGRKKRPIGGQGQPNGGEDIWIPESEQTTVKKPGFHMSSETVGALVLGGVVIIGTICFASGVCELAALAGAGLTAARIVSAAVRALPRVLATTGLGSAAFGDEGQDTRQASAQRDGYLTQGSSHGEPHLVTFDGLKYDHQAVGEFIAAKSRDGAFEVQVREAAVAGSRQVSANSAAAMKVGNTRVAFYAQDFPDSDTNNPLRVDGKPTVVPGGSLSLPGGGTITQIDRGKYIVQWPTGEQVGVSLSQFSGSALLDIDPAVPSTRQGQLMGLLGDFNGNPNDDLRSRDGKVLPPQQTINQITQLTEQTIGQWVPIPLSKIESVFLEKLHKQFGDSWRISQQESLFDYPPVKNTDSFTNRLFPNGFMVLRMLLPQQVQMAEAACREAEVPSERLEGCIFDVGATGDVNFAKAAANALTNTIKNRAEQEIRDRLPGSVPNLPF